MKLAGKVALVTGGNSGIGLATAKLFSQEGAKVIISGRDRNTLDQAASAIGGDVLALQADVADLNQIDWQSHAARISFTRQLQKSLAKLISYLPMLGLENLLP